MPFSLAGTPAVAMSEEEDQTKSAASKEPQPLKGELKFL